MYKIKNKVLIALLIINIFILIYFIYNILNKEKIIYIAPDYQKVVQIDYEKVSQDKILKCLLFLESTNNHNIEVFDTNGKYSLGGYQFQIETIQDILKRFQKRDISPYEAEKLAKSPEASKDLARVAIFEYGMQNKWYNSFKKIKKGKCSEITSNDLAILK